MLKRRYLGGVGSWQEPEAFSVIEKIFAPCRHFLLPRMPRHIFAHGREVSAHAIKAVIFASELALRLFGKGSCSCPFFWGLRVGASRAWIAAGFVGFYCGPEWKSLVLRLDLAANL